ncbi:MAG: TIGR00159 family protein [Aquificae bacterium]|nr:TIGR00159 family protein [Aquificota bacterium]
MGFNDILDILIISVLIYQLLKFLSGTRGWQILIGLIFILSIWLFAKILQLPTVLWIFDNIWQIALFLLIVVFQPELRRGLAKLGESGLFSLGAQSQKRVIDEVVRAVTFLAERKIGALIVFERSVDLENYIEGCVKINAEVNLELLITIFIPQTPLHDGAVIIKDKKIASAHCFLPLTINPNIPKHMGTRHRAAIGISEETDAIAIVVSEERGEISIAVDGKLIKNLDAISLKQHLIKFLGQPPPLMEQIKRKFKKKGKKS